MLLNLQKLVFSRVNWNHSSSYSKPYKTRKTVNLSNNKLTGVVPEFLVQMKSLVIINLSGNDLYGHIPQALRRKGLELLVDENPRLCLSGSCIKDSNKKLIVIVVVSVAAVVISVVVLVLVLVLKKKRPSSMEALQLPPSMPMVNDAYGNSSEPSIETKKEGLLIQSQGYKHFKAEVDLLLRVHHTNLVSLVGYCDTTMLSSESIVWLTGKRS
ncbi:hypothetical protein F2Q68_00007965 [Brassica cretica]|uniref:Serine-threonine/tyrosine-protein kinase catalytic domain-containing protein n=1 Tax=Brassica cretica TaxID=69181 RepID=A0A8S9KWT3_BRACR|nr:hypothetical protein F2Q68_00007965 [Brassica cretica]